jgi:hypothetical protein
LRRRNEQAKLAECPAREDRHAALHSSDRAERAQGPHLSRRTRIEVETVDVGDLPPQEYRRVSPLETVPVPVTDGGLTITQSLTICQYQAPDVQDGSIRIRSPELVEVPSFLS